ncbi:MAG: response regulator [Gammaproteobacteria bacterium]
MHPSDHNARGSGLSDNGTHEQVTERSAVPVAWIGLFAVLGGLIVALIVIPSPGIRALVAACALPVLGLLLRRLFSRLRQRLAFLEESRLRNRTIVDDMSDGVMFLTPDHRIIAMNTAARLMFGCPDREVREIAATELISTDADTPNPLSGPATGAHDTAPEATGRRQDDGREFPIQIAISDTGIGEHPVRTVLIRDLTLEKRALEEMRLARVAAEEADQAKTQFLANMSHEIRTPMNGVLGMLELLADSGLRTEQLDFVRTAEGSAHTLLNLINDILDFSKIDAGKMHIEEIDFDLADNVEEVVALLAREAHEKGLEITSFLEDEVAPMVIGDPYRLRQMLTNLVGNAIKFTDSGEVVVSVSRVDSAPGSGGPSDMVLRFSVRDTGIGVTEEQRERLFKSFHQADGSITRRFGGTGLGLAITLKLAELMGGEAGLEQAPDGGSIFWFTIRVRPSAQERAWTPADLSGRRCLVVDDNHTNREILARYLEHWGVSSRAVEDGASALTALRDAIDRGEPFEIAVIDYQMPVMDGVELTHRIRSDKALDAVRLIMLSSLGLPSEEARRAGVDVSLLKPVRQSLLHETLAKLLTRGRDENRPDDVERDMPPELRGTVLVAEDNVVNQVVARKLLQTLGLKVQVANNGAEAVKAVAGGLEFDLVLMDMQMPEMDGVEATRRIRAERADDAPHLPIIALTANAMQNDVEACMDAGMDDFLSKPVHRKALLAMLLKWLPPAQ